MVTFALDARLAADTHLVAESELSLLLLMDDARYPWLILVPKRSATELHQLTEADHLALTRESRLISEVLVSTCPGDKLNVAALGNVVKQLHVHHVMRHVGDAAWPGPVWGHSPREPRTATAREALLERLRAALEPSQRFGNVPGKVR